MCTARVICRLPPDPNDPDPAKTFRPREKEVSIRRRLRKQQNDKDAFQKLNKIKVTTFARWVAHAFVAIRIAWRLDGFTSRLACFLIHRPQTGWSNHFQ